jgi:hypothetical protein
MKRTFVRRLFADVFFVAKRDKKWWLIPLVIFLVALAGLLVLGSLAGPLAPFVYPLF